MNIKILKKPINKLIIVLMVLGPGLLAVTIWYTLSRVGVKTEEPTTPAVVVPKTITALGRIEPRSEIVSVSAPMLLNADRVAELLVDEGSRVTKGQVIAVLESKDRLEDNLRQAEEQVAVARAKLEQVRAGAKQGEIRANAANVRKIEARLEGERATQRATIRRLEAQLEGERAAQIATIGRLEAEYRNAGAEFERNRQLYEQGAISASSFDTKRLALDTSRQQLNEAKVTLERIERTGKQQLTEARTTLARIERSGQQEIKEAAETLNQVAEVRPVDLRAAEAEINSALAAVEKARTELNQSYIRSPLTGSVVRIHTRVGEQVKTQGIADLAETDRMEVVAEVYQSDIREVRPGQKATVTGSAFPGTVTGEVRLLGLQVDKQDVYSNQPGENFDRKVIEVRIALTPESARKVAGLTNSQVTVSIDKDRPK